MNTVILDSPCVTLSDYSIFFWSKGYIINRKMLIGKVSYGGDYKIESFIYIEYKKRVLCVDLDVDNPDFQPLYDNIDQFVELVLYLYESKCNKRIRPQRIQFFRGESFEI